MILNRIKFSHLINIVVFLFFFIIFIPYPAIPIGSSTGLQGGQLISLLSIPVLILYGIPRRHLYTFIIIISPIIISLVYNQLAGKSSDIMIKSLISSILVLWIIVPAGKVINRHYYIIVLNSVSIALILHFVIGACQIYAYSKNTFFLPNLYQSNPSFPIYENVIELLVLYIRRPFGLFPEPSAMSASIGPWVVLLAGYLFYPNNFSAISKIQKLFYGFAMISAIFLIMSSGSGYIIILFFCLTLLFIPILVKFLYNVDLKTVLILICILMLCLLIWFEFGSQYLRRYNTENVSWQARANSLFIGLTMLSENANTFFFGVGPGQAHLFLIKEPYFISKLFDVEHEIIAIWSIIMNYIIENGILGLFGFCLVFILIIRSIWSNQLYWVGFISFIAWLFSVIFTSSYWSLLPIWLFLAVLISWDQLFFNSYKTLAVTKSARPEK